MVKTEYNNFFYVLCPYFGAKLDKQTKFQKMLGLGKTVIFVLFLRLIILFLITVWIVADEFSLSGKYNITIQPYRGQNNWGTPSCVID